MPDRETVPNTCPHCNRALSPWEQVLLSVDRALMCKGCWYRIILDAFDSPAPNSPTDEKDTEESD